MNKYYAVCAALSLYLSAYTLIGFAKDPNKIDFLMHSEPRPKLLIFSADWCLPCKVARKEMQQNVSLKRILESYDVTKYDFDTHIVERRKYNVNKVPTYIIESGNTEIRRQIGFGGSQKLINFLD